MKILRLVFGLSILVCSLLLKANENQIKNKTETRNLVDLMDVNKIELPIRNDGQTGLNGRTYYPRGQNNLSVLFAGGLATTAYINGELRASWMTTSILVEEWQPGLFTMDPNDPLANFYIVTSNDGPGSQAYIDWVNAVNLGAEFYDLNEDGIYNPYIDKPAVIGDKTIWFQFNDNKSQAQRTARLGTKPIGLEIHATIWAWNRNDDFEDVIFFKYRIINATDSTKNDLIFSIWADPDIGEPTDDLVACDSTLNLGYMYNDADDILYGLNPPAFGVQILQGAIIPSVGDTAYKIKNDFTGIDTLFDMKNLEMQSFIFTMFDNLLMDPVSAQEARYFQLGGLDRFGNPIDPAFWGFGGTSFTNPFYFYNGDPVSASGWRDNTPADKRFLVNCGPFNLAINDTQDIIFAYEVGQGTNAINSVEILRQTANRIKDFVPFGKILTINSNKLIASTDSVFTFYPELFSFSILDSIQTANWNLLSKPASSTAMIISNPDHSANLQPDMAGTYSIELQAVISNGDTISEYLNVEAVNNHPPTAVFTISPNPIVFGEQIELDAFASFDPDGDSLHYDWIFPDWVEENSIDTSLFKFYPPHIGSDELSVNVSDLYFNIHAADSFVVAPLDNGLVLDTLISNYNDIKHLEFNAGKLFILHDYNNKLSILNASNFNSLSTYVGIGDAKFITDGNFVISFNDPYEVIIGVIDSNYIYQELSRIQASVLIKSDLYLNWPYLYLAVFPYQLQIYDISNALSPVQINSYTLPVLTRDVAFYDNTATLYSRIPNIGIITLDISDPNNISALDTLAIPSAERIIDFHSGKIFALNGIYDGSEIIIIDAANPGDLQLASTIHVEPVISGSHNDPILEMKADENYLFVYTKDGVKLFDISDPYNPYEKVNFHTGLSVNTAAWNDPFLYTSVLGENRFSAGLNVLDYDSTFVLNVEQKHKSHFPEDFKLFQNYPNPFNPTTTIKYELPKSSQVKIEICDILGQSVKTLVNSRQNRGEHQIVWDGLNQAGKQVSSGIYFYSLQTENFVKTKKMLLIR